MKKPTPKARKPVLLYFECAAYIEQKCGKNLRDFANRFGAGGNPDNEYQDFWHYLIDETDCNSGGSIYIPEGREPWQKEIAKMFHDEFGPDAEYLVEW